MSSATDAPAPRRGFDLVAYLKLFRFPLVFTAIADSATGHLLTSNAHPEWPVLSLLALTSASLYFFGMSLNDIADRKRDQELSPGRVLPSGRLSLLSASMACGLALLVSLVAVICGGSTSLVQRLAVWGATVFFIVAYNVFLKIPPAMGLVRAGNLMIGLGSSLEFSQMFPDRWQILLYIMLPTFTYVTALTFVSTLEEGVPDRRRLFAGVAVMLVGANLASTIVNLTYYWEMLDTWNPFIVAKHVPISWPATLLSAVLSAWILRRAVKAVDKKGVMLLVRDGVGGIIILDAALLASLYPAYDNGPAYLWIAVAALVLPAIVSVALFKKLA
jgi:4-hydroxybenzoate polyprenyltransferase